MLLAAMGVRGTKMQLTGTWPEARVPSATCYAGAGGDSAGRKSCVGCLAQKKMRLAGCGRTAREVAAQVKKVGLGSARAATRLLRKCRWGRPSADRTEKRGCGCAGHKRKGQRVVARRKGYNMPRLSPCGLGHPLGKCRWRLALPTEQK
jgi:hypothetical protein